MIVIFVIETKMQTTLQAVIRVIWRFLKGKKYVLTNITASWCMTPCTMLDSCRPIEEFDDSTFFPGLYCKNGKSAIVRKAVPYLQIYTASYAKHRFPEYDLHLKVKSTILFCLSDTYKCVNRSVSVKVLVWRTASFLSIDLESVSRKFSINVQNVSRCIPKNFHSFTIMLIFILYWQCLNISLVKNILVFVGHPEQTEAGMLEGRKCRHVSLSFALCLELMTQIVSMSRYNYTFNFT
jgi:hypothetical protein